MEALDQAHAGLQIDRRAQDWSRHILQLNVDGLG